MRTMVARGIRNNNPGNIRLGEKWQGLRKEQTDGKFCQFESMEYGIRALAKLLTNYKKIYGLNTIKSIINKWAPPSDHNNTMAYCTRVSKDMMIGVDVPFDVQDKDNLLALTKSIIRVECGSDAEKIDNEVVEAGVKMAL